jgi:uncharacterized membrane-anchored protein YitT (DUF2179 family)
MGMNGKIGRIILLFTCIILLVATVVVTQNKFLYYTICSVVGGSERYLISGNPDDYQYYETFAFSKVEAIGKFCMENAEIPYSKVMSVWTENEVYGVPWKAEM